MAKQEKSCKSRLLFLIHIVKILREYYSKDIESFFGRFQSLHGLRSQSEKNWSIFSFFNSSLQSFSHETFLFFFARPVADRPSQSLISLLYSMWILLPRQALRIEMHRIKMFDTSSPLEYCFSQSQQLVMFSHVKTTYWFLRQSRFAKIQSVIPMKFVGLLAPHLLSDLKTDLSHRKLHDDRQKPSSLIPKQPMPVARKESSLPDGFVAEAIANFLK